MSEPTIRERVHSRWRSLLLGLALVAILALSAGLRFYRLDGQSLWNDEGTSVALAQRSLARITIDAAADIHPPLYHYLLHYWLAAFGTSEVAARSLSALLGVGLVGLIYLWGRRVFDPATGLMAALVAAISSYQVYYAQEARMYMLLTVLGAASSYLFYVAWLEPVGHQRRWAIVGWVVATVLAVYTHYLAATVILAQNVAWFASLWRRTRRPAGGSRQLLGLAAGWVGVQALVGALYLPWLRLTWDQLHRWPAVSQPFGLAALVKQALPLFTLGPLMPAHAFDWLVAVLFGLVLLGLAWPDRPDQKSLDGRLLALAHWLVPLAVLYYLSRSRPVYHPKFLVLATPGFVLLLGRGIVRLVPRTDSSTGRGLLWLRAGLAGLAALTAVAASLPGLGNYYFDPHYARDDYRGIARYISALGRPGDIVLINAPSQIETVTYYYKGPLPLVPMPLKRPPDREETIAQLTELSEKARRIFGIFWANNESDPEGIVEGWLDGHAYKALDAWYGNVRLVTYALPSQEMGQGIQHPLNVNLAGQIRLGGYALASDQVEAGDILQLNLFWEAINAIPRRYKVFTHVIDDAGHLVGQRDSEPGGGLNFTDTWREGDLVVDHYGLPILPGTPPGEYQIEVGMYNPEDGLRLPVVEGDQAVGDRVVLQRVRIVRPETAPPVAALDMQQAKVLKGPDLELLGCSFGRLGSPPEAVPALRPNDVAELVLFWRAVQPTPDVQVRLQIVDANGRVRLEQSSPPVSGRYPTADWQQGEIVRDPLHLRLPGDLTPGRYRLLIGWQGDAESESAPALRELLTFVVQ